MQQNYIRCPSCGMGLADTTRFCPNCGQPIHGAQPQQQGYGHQQQPYAPPQQPGYGHQQQPYGQYQPVVAAPLSREQERNWAMFCHLASLLGWLIPFADLIATLVIWLTMRERSAFINAHGKEALNYQISFYIFSLIALVLAFFLIGIPLLVLLGILDVVTAIMGAIKASNGEHYRYPISIRMIS